MKNIFLFIGLGLLLSGCEANDSKIYLKCVSYEVTTTDPYGGYVARGDLPKQSSQHETILILDEERKHIYIQNLTEGTYTEKDNIISAEHVHLPGIFGRSGGLIDLQLNKISGDLSVTKHQLKGKKKIPPPYYQMLLQCKKT